MPASLEAIQRHKVTIVDGVPTMYLYMLAHPDFGKYDLSSLRAAVVGGQAMPAVKSTEWFERTGTEVLELWRMTELAGPGIMQHSYCENRLGSVGIMMPFMHGRIADASADAEDIVEYCRKHMAAYKVPRKVQFVPTLPTTSSGKIMRRELKTLDQSEQAPLNSCRSSDPSAKVSSRN
jgi:acyl-coenzyme A synthetase/AMP-(fatty) acid ligase